MIRMVIFARRDIRAKEELCISYKGTPVCSCVTAALRALPDIQDENDQDVLVETKKGKKRQSKTSTAAHVTTRTINMPNETQRMKNRCFWCVTECGL